jgi:mRNA-degrading endonuclease toxin of MazEF toxin-antitoxin module
VNCGGKPVVAIVDQIRAVAKERLQSRMGAIADDEMEAIGESLQQILDLI